MKQYNYNKQIYDFFFNINRIVETSIFFPIENIAMIFFQGCRKSCFNCSNFFCRDEFLAKKLMSVKSVFRKYPNVSGFCYSGGEPLLQAKLLYRLMKKAKKEGKIQLLYTGYDYEKLLENKNLISKNLHRRIKKIITELADLVISGEYIDSDRCTDNIFKGSNNQEIIYNNDRLNELFAKTKIKRNLEIKFDYSGDVDIYGFLQEELVN